MQQGLCTLLLLLTLSPLTLLAGADDELLSACGPMLEDRITTEEFSAFLDKHQDALSPLLADLGSFNLDELKAEMLRVWTTEKDSGGNGASHVLCGEFDRRAIGGLHWKLRYDLLHKAGLLVDEQKKPSSHEQVYASGYRAHPLVVKAEKKLGSFALDRDGLAQLTFGFEAAVKCCSKQRSLYTLLWDDQQTRTVAYNYRGKYDYYTKVVCALKGSVPYIVTLYPIGDKPDQAPACD